LKRKTYILVYLSKNDMMLERITREDSGTGQYVSSKMMKARD